PRRQENSKCRNLHLSGLNVNMRWECSTWNMPSAQDAAVQSRSTQAPRVEVRLDGHFVPRGTDPSCKRASDSSFLGPKSRFNRQFVVRIPLFNVKHLANLRSPLLDSRLLGTRWHGLSPF